MSSAGLAQYKFASPRRLKKKLPLISLLENRGYKYTICVKKPYHLLDLFICPPNFCTIIKFLRDKEQLQLS